MTSLDKKVTAELQNFQTNNNFQDCCSAKRLTFDENFAKNVNRYDACSLGTYQAQAKFPTSQVLLTMRNNLNNYPDIKWQYYGSEEGTMTLYPSNKNCHSQFDPRFRPWYVQASTPVEKDVVIIIDKSGIIFYLFLSI